MNFYVTSVIKKLPINERRLEDIRCHQDMDEVCQQLASYCRESWPKKKLLYPIKSYYQMSLELSIREELFM